MKIYCVFSLESPHRGDSIVYIQYTIFIIKKKTTPDYSKSAAKELFPRVDVALLFYVHGKHLRSCRDGQLT